MLSFEDRTHAPPNESYALIPLWSRRALFASIVGISVLGSAIILYVILAPIKIGPVAVLMIVAFAVNETWVAIIFWNTIFGFLILHLLRRSIFHSWPELAKIPNSTPLTTRTAVVMVVCNEEASASFSRLKAIKRSLDQTEAAASFDYFVLSDSSERGAITNEKIWYAAWCAEDPEIAARVIYRLRGSNWGHKPGNIRDFCKRWGANYAFMVLLDADSLMTGEIIVRLVRIMEHIPSLGILQTLVVGILHPSLFARLYEFGHRQAARCSIVGSSWWQGDRVHFGGHNSVIRIAPFARYCQLPQTPGEKPFGGHVLCHDQIEASLIHRAGYEVRVLPEESGSFEGNPPTIVDYNRRNNRWAQGNFFNLSVASVRGLKFIDRYHLVMVAQRFLTYPALVLFVVLAVIETALWPSGQQFPAHMALALYIIWNVMFFAPRFLGVLDALIREPERYGGRVRLFLSGIVEFVHALFMVPIMMVAMTAFMIGLSRRRGSVWSTQHREGYRLAWKDAAATLWPQTLLGIALSVYLSAAHPAALIWFAPFLFGITLSIPYAVFTSLPGMSSAATRLKICVMPEEIDPPAEVMDVVKCTSINK
jgi:membrane glycosyltransferase